MDAVELNYPVDVPKFMGSDGFVREARVGEDCKPLLNSSIDSCTTSLGHKDETGVVNALHSASWSKLPDAEPCRHATQLPNCQTKELSEQHDYKGTSCDMRNPGPDVVNTHRKAGKMPRSSSGYSKRARRTKLQDAISSAGVDDVKGINDKLGSYSTKCNFPGTYGLKAGIHDVTELVEDLSLNNLLDGTYECPSLGKEKGKKAVNSTENFVHSVRKACSILPIRRDQSQTFMDLEDASQKKVSMCPLSSVSSAATCINGDKEDFSSIELSLCNKDSHGKPETAATPPDLALCQPKDILKHLALPPSKDLDSLLLDATKPSSSARNNSDTRSGKQISRRASLPPFPWSHTFNGCRTNSDTVKISSNKSMCLGRWVKTLNTSNSPGIVTGCFTNLELFAYDPSLIPSGLNVGKSEGGLASTSADFGFCEQGASSLATHTKDFNVPQESGFGLADQGNVGHCPRLLAAAQTLCGMASKCLRQNPEGISRWPKKPSQKVMKARKTKLIGIPEEMHENPSSSLGSDKVMRSDTDQIIPVKRPKLSVVENKKDLIHINGVRRHSIAWSTPRSNRSSPGKSIRDLPVVVRHSTTTAIKPSFTMHSPPIILNQSYNNQHKSRKLMPLDWKRGRER